MTVPVRAALLVDLENAVCGLGARSAEMLDHPERWVTRLAAGADRGGRPPRRFLHQLCYLDARAQEGRRRGLVEAGFRLVDCPPLTSARKNSADVHLVVDAMELLLEGDLDEFVVVSSDTDFRPLLQSIRAHDRRTTVLTAGPAVAAYTVLADSVLEPDAWLVPVPPPLPVPAQRAADAVRRLVAKSVDGTVSGPAAATAALAAWSGAPADKWAGHGSFRTFVGKELRDLEWVSPPQHGRIRKCGAGAAPPRG